MARTKQTARMATGGSVPRHLLATKNARVRHEEPAPSGSPGGESRKYCRFEPMNVFLRRKRLEEERRIQETKRWYRQALDAARRAANIKVVDDEDIFGTSSGEDDVEEGDEEEADDEPM